MGRDAIITFEQVGAAANAIISEGGKPTSRMVRARLGDVGSMGTINKHLSSWKAGQQREIASTLTLPSQLQRVLIEHIESEVISARAALEAEVAAQAQEAADLATENERQAAELEKLNEELESVRADAARAAGRAAQLDTDLRVVRDDLVREREAAEGARVELAKALLRLEAMPRLESDINAAREALEAERSARQAAEQAAAVLTVKLENEAKNATLQAQKAEALQAAAVAEARLGRAGG